ncbi:hypothetical protein NDU88_005441 [Pleurodeles waltl]|uniref:Uncharacterized protein n=1 Tax=Pleurodeles waltl TaxID=8319 RepID=A0AAV7QFB0_PLEWA|nr:hypothetical protein NDU88_005441 [Pleurodeles waltl]
MGRLIWTAGRRRSPLRGAQAVTAAPRGSALSGRPQAHRRPHPADDSATVQMRVPLPPPLPRVLVQVGPRYVLFLHKRLVHARDFLTETPLGAVQLVYDTSKDQPSTT